MHTRETSTFCNFIRIFFWFWGWLIHFLWEMEQIFAEKYGCKNGVIATFTSVILGKLSSPSEGNRQQGEIAPKCSSNCKRGVGVCDKPDCKASKCQKKENYFRCLATPTVVFLHCIHNSVTFSRWVVVLDQGSWEACELVFSSLTFMDILSIGALFLHMTNGSSLICGWKVHLAPIHQ